MIVAGVMSGTSADGINVALVEIRGGGAGDLDVKTRGRGRPRSTSPTAHGTQLRLKFLGQCEFPYPARVRRAVLAAMNAVSASVADLARLNFLLGELYGDAVQAAQKEFRVQAGLVACHGQTLFHQGEPARFLGQKKKIAVTWQTGEAAVVAARTRLPVVSDFRPADMAAGGQGAPLVPFFDYFAYRHPRVGRIAQNIGGIANLTAIPAGAPLERVMAFDTGPGNMVIDALSQALFDKSFDREGKFAAAGRVIEPVVEAYLRQEFFLRKPPKTAGREEFGREFASQFLKYCRRLASRGGRGQGMQSCDAIATATALTVRSIADAVRRLVVPRGKFSELIVSGGGAKNRTLVAWLGQEAGRMGVRLRPSDDLGIPSQAKEAVAFALLGFETWNHRPSNVPSATGARCAAVLGKISFPG